jgi:hypothetical protein
MKVLLALVLLTANAFATDYYVSPTGNDANPGTLTQPFRTPERCEFIMALDGDKCYMRGGQHIISTLSPKLTGRKTFVQYADEIVDLRLADGSIVRFTGEAATWDSPDLSLVQMLTLGRTSSPAPGVTYVELYVDGVRVKVIAGTAMPVLLDYIARFKGNGNHTIQVMVHN